MKPMIKYRGGKSKEIPRLKSHIPRFKGRYVEPFFGGGAMYFFLEPKRALISDINKRLIDFYKGVQGNFALLRVELSEVEALYRKGRVSFETRKVLLPDERVEDEREALYYRLRAQFNGTAPKEFSDALLYYFINKTAYSGMIRYNARGEFNVPFGRYANLNTSLVSEAHSRLLQHAEILNADYTEIFNRLESDDFVFLDPPYDCVFSDYGNEVQGGGWGEVEHRRLASDFANLPCPALMVIGRTQLTEELYGKYIIDSYAKNYAVNIRNRFKAGAEHIVIANYRKAWLDEYPENHTYTLEGQAPLIILFETEQPYGNNQ